MENLTPEHAVMVVVLALVAMGASVAYQCRDSIAAFVLRYVEVRRPVDHLAETSNMAGAVPADDGDAQHQDAVQPGTAGRTGTVVVQGISRTMKPVEIIAVLAVQRDEKGAYRFPADRIARCVGGTRGDVLALVKAIRGTDVRAEQEERTAVIRREQAKLAEMANKAS